METNGGVGGEMKLRAAKKHLRKGKITQATRQACCRFLKQTTKSGKSWGARFFADYLHDMISKKYIDINDINLIGIIKISHKNWHMAKVENCLPLELHPIPTAITKMSFKNNASRKNS